MISIPNTPLRNISDIRISDNSNQMPGDQGFAIETPKIQTEMQNPKAHEIEIKQAEGSPKQSARAFSNNFNVE